SAIPVSVASFFFCFLSSTVWTISETGRVTLDDENQLEGSEEGLPGMCWGCKWMLKKVKAALGNTTKVEKIKSQLSKVCDKIGLLRSQCKKFVAKNVDVLTEELTTTDDVRTICLGHLDPLDSALNLFSSMICDLHWCPWII
uniref:Saposin B-type domain-containing protein n=1 Tax=Oryzias sinensis TaxID=183150 RepID=A0A8C7Z2Q1_9TELE